jgi:hypothetical protein
MTRVGVDTSRLAVDRRAEGEALILARARGQVLHPVNPPAVVDGLGSPNHGRRRRSEKALLRAARRGVVVLR